MEGTQQPQKVTERWRTIVALGVLVVVVVGVVLVRGVGVGCCTFFVLFALFSEALARLGYIEDAVVPMGPLLEVAILRVLWRGALCCKLMLWLLWLWWLWWECVRGVYVHKGRYRRQGNRS